KLLAAAPTVAVSAQPQPPKAIPVGQPMPGRVGGRSRWRIVFAVGGVSLVLVTIALVLSGAFSRTRPQQSAFEETAPNSAARRFQITLRPRPAPLLGHKRDVKAVSIAGDRLASAGVDGTVRIWSLDGGPARRVIPQSVALNAVALSGDGKRVAAGG